MAKRQVFYSFHYKNDVRRVAQIRNIGALEDNKSVSENEWEQVKQKGNSAIEKWIDDNMRYRSCIIVLIGEETSKRPWVDYEIRKAWDENKAILGIYIHNIKDPIYGKCNKGTNPFSSIKLKNGKYLDDYVHCYNPDPNDAYNDIAKNLESWVENAISIRQAV